MRAFSSRIRQHLRKSHTHAKSNKTSQINQDDQQAHHHESEEVEGFQKIASGVRELLTKVRFTRRTARTKP